MIELSPVIMHEGQLNIHGRFVRSSMFPNDGRVYYNAPDPINTLTSYSGSAIPFPNKEFAYSNKLNVGSVKLNDQSGDFRIKMNVPNSYYSDFKGTIILPVITISYKLEDKEYSQDILVKNIPYRSQYYPPGREQDKAHFYSRGWRLPVRTQEQILRSSAYPNLEKNVFEYTKHGNIDLGGDYNTYWNMKPPM